MSLATHSQIVPERSQNVPKSFPGPSWERLGMTNFLYLNCFNTIKMVLNFIFKRKAQEEDTRLANLHLSVSSSFSRVKQDTGRIFQWLDYLHSQNQDQQRIISRLQQELRFVPKSNEDIRRIVDS